MADLVRKVGLESLAESCEEPGKSNWLEETFLLQSYNFGRDKKIHNSVVSPLQRVSHMHYCICSWVIVSEMLCICLTASKSAQRRSTFEGKLCKLCFASFRVVEANYFSNQTIFSSLLKLTSNGIQSPTEGVFGLKLGEKNWIPVLTSTIEQPWKAIHDIVLPPVSVSANGSDIGLFVRAPLHHKFYWIALS